MKKIFIFLMTILVSASSFITDVHAQTYTFHEGERISGVYMTREKGAYHIYEEARFVRRDGDNKAAYCLQPFVMLNNNSYEASETPTDISPDKMDFINKLAYYGYGNRTLGRTDPIWYAVTQIMIWRELGIGGSYYFTDTLDGVATAKYNNLMNEIYNSVYSHDVLPVFDGQTIVLREGGSTVLQDNNGVINLFNENSDFLTIDRNNSSLKIDGIKEGEYEFNLTKNFDADTELLYFYNSTNNQNLMTVGNVNHVSSHIKVKVLKTRVDVTKVDADTKSTTPSGEGELIGAEYDILNKDKKKVAHLVIGEDSKGSVEDLDFGTYYIKETKSGHGYKLDEELHEFTIDEDNPKIELELENKIIKKKVEINKRYGNDNDSKPEKGVVFNIYDNKGNFVDSIITDENGYAYKELVFGKYTFKQMTTSDGYKKVQDVEVNIDDSEDDVIEFDLLDYVIEVPNTYVNNQNCYLLIILMIMFGFVYAKKEIHS